MTLSDGSFARAAVPSGASTGMPLSFPDPIFNQYVILYFFSYIQRNLRLRLENSYMYVCLKLRFYLILGIYEALELRDGGSDYLGKGVSKVGSELKDLSTGI